MRNRKSIWCGLIHNLLVCPCAQFNLLLEGSLQNFQGLIRAPACPRESFIDWV